MRKMDSHSSSYLINRKIGRFSAAVFLIFILLSGAGQAAESRSDNVRAQEEKFSIAVLPVENLSGTMAPLKDIRELFIKRLKAHGFQILDDEDLEKFMSRNRIRYTGGIDWASLRHSEMERGWEEF